jgi:Cupredoxin-like domain
VKLLLASLLASSSLVAAPHPKAPPARLQVVAREYSFTFSRMVLKHGPAVIELDNFGQDRHDLRIQRVGARHIAGLGELAPGSRATLSLNLPPGRYSFWCSVANHRLLGMHATLIVTR